MSVVKRSVHSRRRSVLHLPDWRGGNPYQSLLEEALERNGWRINFADYPPGLFPLFRAGRKHRVGVLHLHWIHHLVEPIGWPRFRLLRWLKAILVAADLALVRMAGIRLVWTVHNLVSHDSPNPDVELRGRRLLATLCHRLIFHSAGAREEVAELYGIAVEDKSVVIPHGNYEGCYVESIDRTLQLRKAFGLPDHTICLLFFGAVRPYKGIDQLLDAFEAEYVPNVRLIIAGRVWCQELGRRLEQAAAKDTRLILRPGFVAEDDVASYLSLADAVVIPFEKTLTSGSVVLAMTHGKALILPRHAKRLGVVGSSGALFFDTAAELASILGRLDKGSLAAMGAVNRRQAAEWTWDTVASATAATYR
jgi:beta-1,4-mannosyltransferase